MGSLQTFYNTSGRKLVTTMRIRFPTVNNIIFCTVNQRGLSVGVAGLFFIDDGYELYMEQVIIGTFVTTYVVFHNGRCAWFRHRHGSFLYEFLLFVR